GSNGLSLDQSGANNASNSRLLGLTIHGFPGDGIRLSNVNNVIIGSTAQSGGVTVVKNSTRGIEITGSNTAFNQVMASFIGTNNPSAGGLSNGLGILIGNGAHDNTIGSKAGVSGPGNPAERNVISGNGAGGGIQIVNASNNRIYNNYIGTSVDGKAALANAGF